VSPLIALMKDQVHALRQLGIPAGSLHAGQDLLEKRAIFQSIRQGGPFLLYLSPERIQKEGFAKWIIDQDVGLFAIDEAHCISQWGDDFREEYKQLGLLKDLRPDVNTIALTASATPLVLNDIVTSLKLASPQKMIHGFYRPNLYYQVETCIDEDDKSLLLQKALRRFPEGRIIVYCGTRNGTEEVAGYLSQHFSGVGYYHAGLDSSLRNSIQQSYQSGKLRILVATNAFGMGIDQPDVRLVVHYNMTSDIDSLYQQMGRAGRDQKDSTCLVLYSKKDKGLQSFFIESSDASRTVRNRRWKALEALVEYLEGGACRHAHILEYFHDSQQIQRCGHCDQCDPHSTRRINRSEVRVILKKKR
jgi:ATP-dependent DNA helicase RecQ